jgi:DNA-binding MarR family transcriptional regulator
MNSNVPAIAQDVLDRCLCKRTRAAARAITRLYDEELRATGLRPSQVELLVTVAAKSELSISALADALDLDRTTLTRNLRPLEKRGLVALSPEGRHRTRLVTLTPTGEAALAGAVAHWRRAQEKMERRLGEAGVASVRQAAAAITGSSSRTTD